MKTVVSVATYAGWEEANSSTADLIELRLDLIEPLDREKIWMDRNDSTLPLIITLRSESEGGRFSGHSDEWFAHVEPWLHVAAYIDVEISYAMHAPDIRRSGTGIIASVHRQDMPTGDSLLQIEQSLRAFGDISKIVVTPESIDDIITLLSFTAHAERPVCTGVMGTSFRFARALLPLFGSELVYCHAGTPTAEGQYHIREMQDILEMLSQSSS